ncbi:hypothetical protein [uncultured Duncaniella sp.]|uniref:hypothetical protein n=1 Tax=uncultured Duncaniella sp. TaxID=2768039 RepID=UPI00260A8140|nr:hypothetical protein [uncultured Duncaniella sp.]
MPDNMDPATDLQLTLDILRKIQSECTSGMRQLRVDDKLEVLPGFVASNTSTALKHTLRVIQGLATDAEMALNRMCISQVKEGKDS